MDIWNKINVDFGGDETGNFGPRQESGISLYQCDTVATIAAGTQVIYLKCMNIKIFFISTYCGFTQNQDV